MTKRVIPLAELVSLFRQMTSPRWENDRLCGQLTVADEEMAALLGELLHEDNADSYPCVVEEGDPERIATGDVLRLQFGRVRTGVGLIVRDVDALLHNSHVATGITQQAWYVHEIDTASWEADKEICRRLAVIGRLVKVLEGTASIFDNRSTALVFLRNGGRFDVPIRYAAKDLMQMNESAAEEIVAQLELEDGHSAQRHEIGATAVCELLSTVRLEERFSELLRQMEQFKFRFLGGYSLFASSFSYQKLRDQAEALKIEYSGRIHKTISDIQGQLLGIPVSTVVVATQFKSADATPEQVWINCAVLFGAIVFFLLVLLAVWNQYQTLSVIETEIDRHEKMLRQEHADIADRLNDVFSSLHTRAFLHRMALAGAVVVCFIGLLVAFAVFSMFKIAAP